MKGFHHKVEVIDLLRDKSLGTMSFNEFKKIKQRAYKNFRLYLLQFLSLVRDGFSLANDALYKIPIVLFWLAVTIFLVVPETIPENISLAVLITKQNVFSVLVIYILGVNGIALAIGKRTLNFQSEFHKNICEQVAEKLDISKDSPFEIRISQQ